MLGCQAVTDVMEVISEDTFKRPVYAGNAIATVKSNSEIKLLTIRPTNFDPHQAEGSENNLEIEEVQCEDNSEQRLSEWVKEE